MEAPAFSSSSNLSALTLAANRFLLPARRTGLTWESLRGPAAGLIFRASLRMRRAAGGDTELPRLRGRGPALPGHVRWGPQRGGGCGGSDGGP